MAGAATFFFASAIPGTAAVVANAEATAATNFLREVSPLATAVAAVASSLTAFGGSEKVALVLMLLLL